ncbi:MAG: hypothetical protein WD468_05520 [Pirellulales bacterium]
MRPALRFFYSCRSTAGGRPRCKGVHYPAWEFEQAVCEIFNDPAIWRDLLGSSATNELIDQVMETWSVMLWPWKRDWLKGAVKRIEIHEADSTNSTVSITFSPDAANPFLDEYQALMNPPVNRSIPEQ